MEDVRYGRFRAQINAWLENKKWIETYRDPYTSDTSDCLCFRKEDIRNTSYIKGVDIKRDIQLICKVEYGKAYCYLSCQFYFNCRSFELRSSNFIIGAYLEDAYNGLLKLRKELDRKERKKALKKENGK